MTEVTLLILTGLSSLRLFEDKLIGEGGNWLIQLAPDTGFPTLSLLLVMNILLIALYFRPAADLLWWLNLTALTSLTAGALTDFSSAHVLVALSIVFALAYRRVQGLKHIWHWRGLLLVGLGVFTGLCIASSGFGWPGFTSLFPLLPQYQ